MEGIKQYLISITAAAVITGLVLSIVDAKSSVGKTLRTVASIFLLIAFIGPVVKLDLTKALAIIDQDVDTMTFDTEQSAQDVREVYEKLIIERTGAYILDEANTLGARVDIAIELDDSEIPTPEKIILEGEISPYAKSQLSTWISENLGVSRENQIWK